MGSDYCIGQRLQWLMVYSFIFFKELVFISQNRASVSERFQNILDAINISREVPYFTFGELLFHHSPTPF